MFVCVYTYLFAYAYRPITGWTDAFAVHGEARAPGAGHGEAQLDGAWTVGWLKVIYCFKCNLHARKSDRMKEEAAAAAEDEKAEKNNAFAF